MKPQNRNFIVEVKRSRLATKVPKRSIWGTLDLSRAIAEEAALDEPKAAPSLLQNSERASSQPSIKPQKRRILSVVAEPAPSAKPVTAIHDDAVKEAVEAAAESVPPGSEVRSRRTRRKRRLQLMEKPLPPGQKWKRRLPRVLQKPD